MSTTVYVKKPEEGRYSGAEQFILLDRINGLLDDHGYGLATVENTDHDEFFAVTLDADAAFAFRMFAPFPVLTTLPEIDRVASLEELLTPEQKDRLAAAREARAKAFAAGTVPTFDDDAEGNV